MTSSKHSSILTLYGGIVAGLYSKHSGWKRGVNSFSFRFNFCYTQDFGNMKSIKDINIPKISKRCEKQG